jgi:hypothetical protein
MNWGLSRYIFFKTYYSKKLASLILSPKSIFGNLMIHRMEDLRNKRVDRILEELGHLHAGITSLDFSHNFLYRKTGIELAQILAGLSATITELNLSFNILMNTKTPELALALAKLTHIISLDISWNTLGGKTGGQLAAIIAALTPSVTSLNLSANDLGCRNYEQMLPRIRLDPAISLVNTLGTALAALPKTIIILDLGENNLGYRTGPQLATSLARIPHTVETLDLACNDLDRLGSPGLSLVLSILPTGVKTLGLSENNFNRLTAADLAKTLAKIPASVTFLDLRWNDLSSFSEAELTQIFAAIPRTVRMLDLRGNNFGNTPRGALTRACTTLPADILIHFDDGVRPKEVPAPPLEPPSTLCIMVPKDRPEKQVHRRRANRGDTVIPVSSHPLPLSPAKPSSTVTSSFSMNCLTSFAMAGFFALIALILWLKPKAIFGSKDTSTMAKAALFAAGSFTLYGISALKAQVSVESDAIARKTFSV